MCVCVLGLCNWLFPFVESFRGRNLSYVATHTMLPDANRTAFYYSLCRFNLSHITDVISPDRRLAFSEDTIKGDFSKKENSFRCEQIFKNSRGQSKILGAWRVTINKLHTEHPQFQTPSYKIYLSWRPGSLGLFTSDFIFTTIFDGKLLLEEKNLIFFSSQWKKLNQLYTIYGTEKAGKFHGLCAVQYSGGGGRSLCEINLTELKTVFLPLLWLSHYDRKWITGHFAILRVSAGLCATCLHELGLSPCSTQCDCLYCTYWPTDERLQWHQLTKPT